jgi:hypothetical protein
MNMEVEDDTSTAAPASASTHTGQGHTANEDDQNAFAKKMEGDMEEIYKHLSDTEEGFHGFSLKIQNGIMISELGKMGYAVFDENKGINGKVNVFLMKKKSNDTTSSPRVRDTEFAIAGTEMICGSYELQHLQKSMLDLFQWYTNEETKKTYAAPLQPIIQSSGCGKTKLLYEFRQKFKNPHPQQNTKIKEDSNATSNEEAMEVDEHSQQFYNDYHCKFVSCLSKDKRRDIAVDRSIYDQYLPNASVKDVEEIINNIKSQRIVLLLDEAQDFAIGTDRTGTNKTNKLEGLRKLLRRKRKSQQVIIFVAGTHTTLANCYPTDEERKSSREGESKEDYYDSGPFLYPPIYEFFTMGCFKNIISVDNNEATEFVKALPYGRPLFARLLLPEVDSLSKQTSEHRLPATQRPTDEDVAIVATRLLLNTRDPFVAGQENSVASVWATRVQLSSVHMQLADALVAKAYAHLTDYKVLDPNANTDTRYTSVSFRCLPDPMCSRVAMCLMQEHWKCEPVTGFSKIRWVQKLQDILSCGLCLAPRGDVGEILAAAYLLLCGDEVRFQRDKTLETFSIPVDQWWESLVRNSDSHLKQETKPVSKNNLPNVPYINFLQFCRCDLRFGLKDLCQASFLEDVYRSCVAYYAYNNCPSYDAFSSLAMIDSKSGDTTYSPLIISVKTVKDFSPAKGQLLADTIVEKVIKVGQTSGLVLVVLLDSGKDVVATEAMESDPETTQEILEAPSKKTRSQLSPEETPRKARDRPITECCQHIVSKVLVIPEGDRFGITNVARRLTQEADDRTMFSCHQLLGTISGGLITGCREDKRGHTSNLLLVSASDEQKLKLESLWNRQN